MHFPFLCPAIWHWFVILVARKSTKKCRKRDNFGRIILMILNLEFIIIDNLIFILTFLKFKNWSSSSLLIWKLAHLTLLLLLLAIEIFLNSFTYGLFLLWTQLWWILFIFFSNILSDSFNLFWWKEIRLEFLLTWIFRIPFLDISNFVLWFF